MCFPRRYIFPKKENQITFAFAISFTDEVDKAIASIMLRVLTRVIKELADAQRQVSNAPAINFEETEKISSSLIKEFPELKNETCKFNGILEFSLILNLL